MIEQNLKHLAIIMDGNRRWAKARFLPAIFGHKAGFDNVKKISDLAQSRGIKYLTLWALSTENLQKRSEDEVNGIIKLIGQIPKFIPEFMKQWYKLHIIWDTSKLPEETQKILSDVLSTTSENTWMHITVALVYGWQDEILRATKKIIAKWIKAEDLTQEEFWKYLDTHFLPPADVIVRTGW